MTHRLPELNYPYNALEPFIDARTMEIHHSKHHQTYVDKLNAALKNYPDLQEKTLKELVAKPENLPQEIKTAVINNGGGHFNHSFFWQIMTPQKGGEPKGILLQAIKNQFGDFSKFKEQFSQAALNFFGSGWVWLVGDKSGKIEIISTQGHSTPLAENKEPLLVIDVWEHAYYLKYQNRKGEYIDAWWNVVNWEEAGKNYQNTIS